MKKLTNKFAIYLTSLLPMSLFGEAEVQSSISDQAAAYLATNAKYHVVVAVLVVILLGLVVYGLILNRKISNLEANQK
jgi:hypothetical protein